MWHHEAYRLPLHDVQDTLGLDPDRGTHALWALFAAGGRNRVALHQATRITYEDLGRVHDAAYLETLMRPNSLAQVFGLHRAHFPVDPVVTTLRLACGGTAQAAAFALAHRCTTANLLGGFHHAFPDRGRRSLCGQ